MLDHDPGIPLLLSGKNSMPLSRVGTEHSGTEKYQECLLQELIDQQPSGLPMADLCPGVTGLFSLGREIWVDLGGGNVGFIDNMLVTDDGHLVVVETKLWRNPESTREVVAQTLQYGMAVSRHVVTVNVQGRSAMEEAT